MKIKIILVFLASLFLGNTKAWSQPDWSVDARQYENSMNVTGIVLINGEENKNSGNRIGAFVDDVCRGVGTVTYVASLDRYVIFLTVYGDDDGEEISFKIYRNENDQIYEGSTTIDFEINGVVGSSEDPYEWNITVVADEGDTTQVQGCAGSSFNLFAESSLSYKWNTGETTRSITVSESGTYSCTRKVNDTTLVIDYWLVDLEPFPEVNLGADTSLCVGETLVLDAQNPGATYLWSTGDTTQSITITTPGTYSVTVASANNCTSFDEIVIEETADCNSGGLLNACEGDIVTINVTEANATSYLWSTGETTASIEVTASVTLSVSVALSGGGSMEKNYQVVFKPAPQINIADTVYSCVGESLDLNVYNEGCSYLWSTGDTTAMISINQSGDYYVEVSNTSGCSVQQNIRAEFLTPTLFSFDEEIIEVCSDDLLALDPNVANMEYLWSTGATTQTIIPTETGLYSLTITNQGGCESSDQVYVIIDENETRFVEKTILMGETYQFYGSELSESGIYTYVDSSYTCPQKVVLNLNVIETGVQYGKISGSLQYSQSSQLGGAIMLLYPSEGDDVIAAQTQSDGSYSFDFVPAGSYFLCAMVSHLDLPGSPADCYYNDAYSWNDATLIDVDEGNSINISITLQARGATETYSASLTSLHNVSGNLIFIEKGAQPGIFVMNEDEELGSSSSLQAARIVLYATEGEQTYFYKSVLSDENGTYNFNNVPPGNYYVEVEIPGLVQQDTVLLNITGTENDKIVNFRVVKDFGTAVNEIESDNALLVYPNPCSETLTIEQSENVTSIARIYNLSGKCIKEKSISGFYCQLNVKDLVSGVYLIKIENTKSQMLKFVKK